MLRVRSLDQIQGQLAVAEVDLEVAETEVAVAADLQVDSTVVSEVAVAEVAVMVAVVDLERPVELAEAEAGAELPPHPPRLRHPGEEWG